jgi:fido (protein-threonine AMPylation protein)
MARGWHRAMMNGLNPPKPEYVGRFKGEAGLEGLGVRIGDKLGVASDEVAPAVASFESTLQTAVRALDPLIDDDLTADQVAAVIELCAWAHCEWIRIHPFANGNGRIARLWANFIAMRYGLPPFVRLRPRPDNDYAAAAVEAMDGRWQAMARLFTQIYRDALRS